MTTHLTQEEIIERVVLSEVAMAELTKTADIKEIDTICYAAVTLQDARKRLGDYRFYGNASSMIDCALELLKESAFRKGFDLDAAIVEWENAPDTCVWCKNLEDECTCERDDVELSSFGLKERG